MPITLHLAACALFALAAYRDLTARRIPNWIVGAVALVALARWAMLGAPMPAIFALSGGLAVFAVGAALFACGKLGGGDVKLATASAMLVGGPAIPAFLLIMTMVGGALSAAALAYTMLTRRRALVGLSGAATRERLATVPYGVAIAAAAIILLVNQFRGG